MKTLPILFIVVFATLLTSCSTSKKLTFAERQNIRSEALYLSALSAIEKKDYIRAYLNLDSSYYTSKKREIMLPKIQMLITNEPGVVRAIVEAYTIPSFQAELKNTKYKNESHAKVNIAYRVERLKIIHPEKSKYAEKNFISFFNNTPEHVLIERRKAIAEGTKKLKQKIKKGTYLNITAKGNLKVTKPISCVDISYLTSLHTPADIFTGISDCIKKDEVYNAVRLYALALSYGRYDQLRMVDKTSRGAISVLKYQIFATASKEYKVKFNIEKNKQASNSKDNKKFKTLCNGIKTLGKPGYHPNYMIRHGMSVFTGQAKGVLPDFNEEEEWSKIIHSFLKCS